MRVEEKERRVSGARVARERVSGARKGVSGTREREKGETEKGELVGRESG